MASAEQVAVPDPVRALLPTHLRVLASQPSCPPCAPAHALLLASPPLAHPKRRLPAPPQLFVEEPDFSDSDPSARDGFRVVFDKQCPFEMRLQEHDQTPQEVGTLEAITCRVCVQGDTAAPTAVRLELSSEQDLFFHFQHTLDERAFRLVREEQRLMIEFQDYASVLARSLNQAIKEPHTHLAVFIQNRDGNARLDFIQVRGGAGAQAGGGSALRARARA